MEGQGMEVVVVALIAGVLGPATLAWLTGRQRRDEKREDWARQDEVARLLQQSGEEAAGKLDRLAAGQQQIHTLVNSNMTAAMQSDLDANKRDLVSMRRIVQLTKDRGDPPLDEDLAAIAATEHKIAELSAELEDRLESNTLAEAQLRAAEDPDKLAADAAAAAARAAAIAARADPEGHR